MKYLKTLGLLALAATTLMVLAGSASATLTVTTKYDGEIVATSTNSQLDGFVEIVCKHSEVKGTPSSAGATSGSISSLAFTECNRSVTVLDKGTLSITSAGTVTSTGARVTVQTTILGFPIHCIYATNATDVGTLTEGVAPAKMHIGSAPIPQEATSSMCSDDAEWTGTYTVTKPATAIVVD